MSPPEIAKYLNRIELDDYSPNLENLRKLQHQHMECIPFENLDIVVGRAISLNHDHLFEKIITHKRGGYCFELNTLYAELLKSLGFLPRAILGRVWLSNPKKTPPRNHLAYILDLNGKTYITDVGFGGLVASIPLDINISSPVSDKDGKVRVTPFREGEYMIQRLTEKGWTNLYSFETVEISEEDIRISNWYMSTNINSHFFYHRFVGKNTKAGRIALFNNKISIRKGIKVIDKERVEFGKDWLQVIKNDFSIDLDFSEKEFAALFKSESLE